MKRLDPDAYKRAELFQILPGGGKPVPPKSDDEKTTESEKNGTANTAPTKETAKK